MLADGFGPFILVAAIGDPTIVASGALIGLLARKWWHLIPGAAVPPLAHWTFYSLFYSVDHFAASLPFLGLAGTIWVTVVHGAKRAWTR